MSFQSLMMRIMCSINDRKRDKGLRVPEEIEIIRNLSYGPGKYHVADVYRPSGGGTNLPAIVSVHGGAWVYGNKEVYKHYCMDLAKRGFVVINFTYRLSPKYKFPCHLEDTVLLFDWLMLHTEQFGIDKRNIFALGDSAGAHILSLYCAFCTNPAYAKSYAFNSKSNFIPKAVALNCGIYDMRNLDFGAGDTKTFMKDVLPQGGTQDELEWVSSLLHMNEKFPPAYIMTANGDFLKEQAQPLYEQLSMLGIECTLKVYGDETESLGHVFHLDMHLETGRKCNDDECAFFFGYVQKQ